MNVGWVGLGKLGLPIAEEIAKTHDVFGYDPAGVGTDLVFDITATGDLVSIVDCDLIFVAVQTPHGPEFEGITPLPDERADFDYSYLTAAVRELAGAGDRRPPLVIISTVLPGTIEREILPLWDGPVVYNPFFIAMGEEVADFLDPEFVLIGLAGPDAQHNLARSVYHRDHPVYRFYDSLGLVSRIIEVGYREAELAKMAYNTFIGLKIAFANTIGELCHRLSIDADQVIDVLRSGHKRIVSDRYLDPGMGDGGPCHPRDNIALSWLAGETGMSFDLFGAIMEQRERHTDWLAQLVAGASLRVPLDDPEWQEQYRSVTVLGKAYKPDTQLQTGSPALLLAAMLTETGVDFAHEDDPA